MGRVQSVFVRHGDINDVSAWLRDQGERAALVLPPADASDAWVGVFPSLAVDRAPGLAERLSRDFGAVVEVDADGPALRFLREGQRVGEARADVLPTGPARKEAARKMAAAICHALDNPRLQTKLARLLGRDDDPAIWLERTGEVLHLPASDSTYDERMADGGWERYMWVDAGRIRGKISSALVGAGYTDSADMVEDTTCDLLRAGRYRAVVMHLSTYDIRLEVRDGELACKAPAGFLTPTLREALGHHRDRLLAALTNGS